MAEKVFEQTIASDKATQSKQNANNVPADNRLIVESIIGNDFLTDAALVSVNNHVDDLSSSFADSADELKIHQKHTTAPSQNLFLNPLSMSQ